MPVDWRNFQGETNAEMRFDFPFVYVMHTAEGPRLFTEAQEIADLLGWPKVTAQRKPGAPGVPGYGVLSQRGLVLGVRSRWVDPADPTIATPTRIADEQRSRRQMLVLLLGADGVTLPVTFSAKSTASKRLFDALALANRAGTRALGMRGGPKVQPPTYTWRLLFTAHSEQARNDRHEWTSREIVPTVDGIKTDLDSFAADEEDFQTAHELYTSIGHVWRDAWGEPPSEPDEGGDEGGDEGPPLTQEQIRAQAASEAAARDEAAAADAARWRNEQHRTGAM